MIRKNLTLHNSSNSFTSLVDTPRRISIRRRLIERQRSNDTNNKSHIARNIINNSMNNFNQDIRENQNDENNSLISNTSNIIFIHNQSGNTSPLSAKKIGKHKFSRFSAKKKELSEIEEEKQKEDNNFTEIKDTVKCYICFNIITKPKMCPCCHRIACEKCLYNWFMVERKKYCGFCRKKLNFYEMVSVPFMSTVVDFVEKIFDKDKDGEIKFSHNFQNFCENHPNEQIYYFCLDCNRGYCKTCFVFFGEEKDKHINHNIIEYEKYKNLNVTSLKTYDEKINASIDKAKENIKRCYSYKNAYNFERNEGNQLLDNLKKEFNKQIDDNLRLIDDEINKLEKLIEKYEKYKTELNNYYSNFSNQKINESNIYSYQKISQELTNKLSFILSEKLYSSKELEKLIDLSKSMYFQTYQSKYSEFKHENRFFSKNLKIGNSPYELIIDNKEQNEININLLIPKDKITFGHNFKPFVFIRIKGCEATTYELEEGKEDNKFFYFKKKIPWNYYGESSFKIKGLLYDYYFV